MREPHDRGREDETRPQNAVASSHHLRQLDGIERRAKHARQSHDDEHCPTCGESWIIEDNCPGRKIRRCENDHSWPVATVDEASTSRLTSEETMERVTLRVPVAMLDGLDTLVEADRYPNRSAAIRAGCRTILARTDGGHAEPVDVDDCRDDGCDGIYVIDRDTIEQDTVRFECTACESEKVEDGDRVRARLGSRLSAVRDS